MPLIWVGNFPIREGVTATRWQVGCKPLWFMPIVGREYQKARIHPLLAMGALAVAGLQKHPRTRVDLGEFVGASKFLTDAITRFY